jgi:septal ring factor EnvC (AmiA/AmiB activator)
MKEAHEDETKKVKVKLEEQTKQFKVVKSEHAAIENDSKTWNKAMKAKEKDIYNLTKENKEIKEKLKISKKDIVHLNLKINKEKKECERRDNKEKKKEALDTLQTEMSSPDLLAFPAKFVM